MAGDRPVIVWFRRDLRLADNETLATAARLGPVVPLFVWDPALLRTEATRRTEFLAGCVASLDREIRIRGGRLVIRRGPPEVEVAALARAVQAQAVFVSADFGPYGRQRDLAVKQSLGPVPLIEAGSAYLASPGQLTRRDGSVPRFFSAYWRRWQELTGQGPISLPPLRFARAPETDASIGPSAPSPSPGYIRAGERAALERLEEFAATATDGYMRARDRLDQQFTSGLSPYLRFGCIHPRTIVARLGGRCPELLRQLCWRDFFAATLWENPQATNQPLRPGRGLPIETKGSEERLRAWQEARTGYPIVDAAMRQLAATGWISNRARLIVAGFLVADLHVSWRHGARWFMTQLLDGDVASNQLNWQWVAGCGSDPSPYLLILNPTRQALRFDPQGHYVRRWLEELSHLNGPSVHTPWEQAHGLSRGYWQRICDHDTEAHRLREWRSSASRGPAL
jgi:deoxyribodipyrimidine photo-lyase